MANIIPTSHRYDIVGPIGKTPKDVANLLDILVDRSEAKTLESDYASSLTGDWADISVGTLDPRLWKFPGGFCKPVPEADKQMVRTLTSLR